MGAALDRFRNACMDWHGTSMPPKEMEDFEVLYWQGGYEHYLNGGAIPGVRHHRDQIRLEGWLAARADCHRWIDEQFEGLGVVASDPQPESWRLLEEGEVIEHGDEYCDDTSGWKPIMPETLGYTVGSHDYPYRRKITPNPPAI